MTYPKIVKGILSILTEHKGEDIKVFQVKDKTPFYDYIVIASASSNRALDALAGYIEDYIEKVHSTKARIEGKIESEWLLIDAKDVVVHLLSDEKRKQFNLEELLH